MRKIERQLITAINTPGSKLNSSNTQVRWSDDHAVVEVLLHGHIIATINFAKSTLVISNCGYDTNVTKSRLNAILSDLVPGARIFANKFEWFISLDDQIVEFCFVDGLPHSF
jgi:hypothetical protein